MKLTPGQIRFYARQEFTPIFSLRSPWSGKSVAFYRSVPIFRDNRINKAIMAHEERIRKRRTHRRKSGPSIEEFD